MIVIQLNYKLQQLFFHKRKINKIILLIAFIQSDMHLFSTQIYF